MGEQHGCRDQRAVERQVRGCLGYKSLKTSKQLRILIEKKKVT